jgi:hypothetical protein
MRRRRYIFLFLSYKNVELVTFYNNNLLLLCCYLVGTYSINLVICRHINNEWLVFFEKLKNLGVLNLFLKILRCSSRTSALKIFSSSIILDLKNKIKHFSVIFINSKKMKSVKPDHVCEVSR